MKTKFTQKFLMAFLMIGLFTTSQAQTYVNGAASGANDGSSWADAYTDLSAALDAATAGDVWIAAGTYVPADAGLDSFNTFLIMNPVNVYGGFAGTEASIGDRVDGNVTVLSGDVAGDDTDNVFTANKDDNLFHVMTIDVGDDDIVILDGLTISGGSTSLDNSSGQTYVYSGGGVYATSTVEINNCDVNNNSARSGGGLYFEGNHSGSKIINSNFSKHSGSFGAAILLTNGDDYLFDNNTFSNNAVTTSGGGVYLQDLTNFSMQNCMFSENSGQFGGAYITIDCSSQITNCDFIENTSPNIGGAIVNSGGEYTMTGCYFEKNRSISSGGAIFEFDGEGNHVNNTFKDNESGQSGGAINQQGGTHTYDRNTFDSNNTTNWGGALFVGFNAVSINTNSLYIENRSNEGPAGAIWAQNDTTELSVETSQFLGNLSGGSSGAIGTSGPIPLTLNKCFFGSNEAEGFGGAVNGTGADGVGDATATISNCIFLENFTQLQGAGVNFNDYDVNITNSDFSGNTNQGAGAGGAMSLNVGDTTSVEINISHSTIVNNFAFIGAGIATFTDSLDSKLSLTLTNTILANEDSDNSKNYEVEAGTPKFSSLGGNVSTDATTSGAFTNTNDINETDFDALFVDASEFDFLPASGSVLINNGIEAGLSEDINGNVRDGAPDSGAYESNTTSTEEVLENNGQLTMTPNPAATVSTITVDNAWNGAVNIIVTDMTGKVVANQNVIKSAQTQDFNLNVSDLSGGNYILTLRAEDAVVSTQFIKI